MTFRDRGEAGRRLAERLASYAWSQDVLVLALPRGGVPVAYEVAQALSAPLDVFIVRKLGLPGQEELAMGAIASGGVCVLNDEIVRLLPNAPALIQQQTEIERRELERREAEYRGERMPLDIAGKIVILVDDGLATGATMRAAAAAVRAQGAASIIVAVPVGAEETLNRLRDEVDEVVCLLSPPDFHAVGQFYDDFTQTTDRTVKDLLSRANGEALWNE